MQQTIRKVICANLQTTNLLLSNPTGECNWKIFEPQVEWLAMLSHVHTQLSQLRREQIKPALKSEYNTICSADIPIDSEYLFGDNLAKQLRDAKEASKVRKAIYTTQEGHKGQGHTTGSKNYNVFKARRDFLWKGHNKPYKRKKQQSAERK